MTGDILIERARLFATAAHAAVDQRRKYTGEAYIVHPRAVAALVQSVPHTPAMIAAAWLHDVVEDTKITSELIRAEFGDEVADLVAWLTDSSKSEDGNRVLRKSIDRQHTADAPPEAKTIKLADLIDNSRTIFAHDRAFGRTYMREKESLLDVLQEGDKSLMSLAKMQLEEFTGIIH